MSNANVENNANPPLHYIHVSGIGKSSIKPDKADLTLSVEVQAKTAESARKQAAATMEILIRALKNANVADRDIQTRSISLYPNYSSNTVNKVDGYQLTNQVAVCIRDVNKASEVIDAAVLASGNATRVQGIAFGVENNEPALAEARQKAYEDAKRKAAQYAKMAALTLGAPLQISEANDMPAVPMPYAEMRMSSKAAETPIQPGEQEVTVTVNIMFGVE